MPRVLLYSLFEPALVIAWKSGVVYQNQVRGTFCDQLELEGILAPLDFEPSEVEELMRITTEQYSISEELADQIDAMLHRRLSIKFISVDRERLKESCEAWVFVKLGAMPAEDSCDSYPREDNYYGDLFGFAGCRAVLTWANSD